MNETFEERSNDFKDLSKNGFAPDRFTDLPGIVNDFIKTNSLSKVYVVDIGNSKWAEGFEHFTDDIVSVEVPPCDLVILRDILQVLPIDDAKKALQNAVKNARYSLINYSSNITQNIPKCKINKWRYRPLNVLIEPFNLPIPARTFEEGNGRFSGVWEQSQKREEKTLIDFVSVGEIDLDFIRALEAQDYPLNLINCHFINSTFATNYSHNNKFASWNVKTIELSDVDDFLQSRISLSYKAKISHLAHFSPKVRLNSESLSRLISLDKDLVSPQIPGSDHYKIENGVVAEISDNYVLKMSAPNARYYGVNENKVINLSNSIKEKYVDSSYSYVQADIVQADIVQADIYTQQDTPVPSQPVMTQQMIPITGDVLKQLIQGNIGGFDTMKFFREQKTHQPHIDNFITYKGIFTNEEITRIFENAKNLPVESGTVGPREIHTQIRKSNIRWIPNNPTNGWLYEKISQIFVEANKKMWNYHLTGLTEMIQLTEYSEDDQGFYDYHMDSGYVASHRKLSITIQLSDPEYSGGDLQFLVVKDPLTAEKTKGSAIVFPSYMIHRVLPVTKGKRYSLVCWCSGPPMI